jgi:L,D-transpeptidase ErfK/SrfK
MKIFFLSLLGFSLAFSAQALIFPLPPKGQDVVGQIQVLTAKSTDTLSNLGMAYDVGRDPMKAVNPLFKADVPLAAGVPIVIPSRFLLPDYPRQGIVVNVSQMRLYYYPPGKHMVMIYPIGIGKAGHMTPLGKTYVTHKQKNPLWIPPQSIRDFNKKRGIILPRVIRGGPDNPLGQRAIYLKIPEYLIHASNFPQSIGSRGSFGCMRMMERDINQLFPYIARHTTVMIIEQPYTAGWFNGQLYMEINKPLAENSYKFSRNLLPVLKTLLFLSTQHRVAVDWHKVTLAMQNESGMPTVVSDTQASPVSTNLPVKNLQLPSVRTFT